MSDNERADIFNRKDSLLGTIVTIKSNGILYPKKSGEKLSLFLPGIVEFRTDKIEADNLGQVKDQFANAVKKITDLL